MPSATSKRPVLLVGNHQLFGLDLPILIDAFLQERDVLVRGLARVLGVRWYFGRVKAVSGLRAMERVFWRAT